MQPDEPTHISRRAFAAGAAAFLIVPRHVLGGQGYVAPSDKVNLATIGLGRQGEAITMELLARPDVQVIAVCDCNKSGRTTSSTDPMRCSTMRASCLGPGYENWGADLTSPGEARLAPHFETSLGMGGREPAKRLVEAYYGSRKGSASGAYKGCAAYADYRELLAKENGLDAVYVATPDHWHAPIAITAMRQHKHVLGQKPMAHSIADAHRMAATAKEMKVATSVTVNNPSSDSTHLIAQWIDAGAIGHVREVHNWSSRPFWPQGIDRPTEVQPIPAGLDWDMWLGPAPERPYNNAYLPFVWRGWYDFGCGSFGDMGCYSFAGIFKILGLTPPLRVESSSSDSYPETFPKASMVHLTFPAVGNHGEVRMSWYDGGLRPPRPAGIEAKGPGAVRRRRRRRRHHVRRRQGYSAGRLQRQQPARLSGIAQLQGATAEAAAVTTKSDVAIDQWIAACKGGPAASRQLRDSKPGYGIVPARVHGAALSRRTDRVGRGQHEGDELAKAERLCGSTGP